MHTRNLMICLILFSTPCSVPAGDSLDVLRRQEGAEPPAAGIETISWLAGRWVGEGLGGGAEDIIAPASGGQMMGMFRHSKADGSNNFYEFYLFAEQAGSLTVRLKHFSPMLAGWEGKDEFVEFPLVAIEERKAQFDGLTYRLEEDDSLTVGVRIAEDQIAVFRYRKAGL
jgi:hypothetical protein